MARLATPVLSQLSADLMTLTPILSNILMHCMATGRCLTWLVHLLSTIPRRTSLGARQFTSVGRMAPHRSRLYSHGMRLSARSNSVHGEQLRLILILIARVVDSGIDSETLLRTDCHYPRSAGNPKSSYPRRVSPELLMDTGLGAAKKASAITATAYRATARRSRASSSLSSTNCPLLHWSRRALLLVLGLVWEASARGVQETPLDGVAGLHQGGASPIRSSIQRGPRSVGFAA